MSPWCDGLGFGSIQDFEASQVIEPKRYASSELVVAGSPASSQSHRNVVNIHTRHTLSTVVTARSSERVARRTASGPSQKSTRFLSADVRQGESLNVLGRERTKLIAYARQGNRLRKVL